MNGAQLVRNPPLKSDGIASILVLSPHLQRVGEALVVNVHDKLVLKVREANGFIISDSAGLASGLHHPFPAFRRGL